MKIKYFAVLTVMRSLVTGQEFRTANVTTTESNPERIYNDMLKQIAGDFKITEFNTYHFSIHEVRKR